MRHAKSNSSDSPAMPVEQQRSETMATLDLQARLIAHCTALYRAREADLLAGTDREAVHQARIALRQIRAVLGVFKKGSEAPAKRLLRTEIRWLARALGGVRDWEVFRFSTLSGLPPEVLEPIRRQAFEAATTARITRARRQLRRVLLSGRYRKLQALLDAWGRRPARPRSQPRCRDRAFDTRSVAERTDRAMKRRRQQLLHIGRRLSRADDERMHAVRRAAKNLRYCNALLAPSHRHTPAVESDRTLRHLQEALGAFNDVVVAQRHLRDLAAAARTSKHAPIRSRQLEEHLERLRVEARANVMTCWKHWRKTRRLQAPHAQRAKIAPAD